MGEIEKAPDALAPKVEVVYGVLDNVLEEKAWRRTIVLGLRGVRDYT